MVLNPFNKGANARLGRSLSKACVMSKTAIAVPMLCLTLLMLFGCSGESQEDIALEVAENWTDDSIENVSDSVVQLVVGEYPIVSRLAGDHPCDTNQRAS